MRNLSTWVKRAGLAIAIGLFVVSTSLLIASRASGRWQFYAVSSASMTPAIPVGSLVIAQSVVSAADLQPGQIITFTDPGNTRRLVTHRIAKAQLGETGLTFTTKGDANASNDSWVVTPQSIRGRVIRQIPYLGRAVTLLQSKSGIIIGVIMPLTLLLVLELRSLFELLVELRVADRLSLGVST